MSSAGVPREQRPVTLIRAGRPAVTGVGRSAREIVSIFGVPLSAITYEEARERVRAMVRSGHSHHLVLANVHTLNVAYADEAYRRTLQHASLVLRDGVGLELAAALKRRPLAHNFCGTDFVPWLLADLPVRVFLYGSVPGVATTAARVLQQRNPLLQVLGTEHGYDDAERVVARVAAACPDVLLVALGNPLQEQWIARNLARLNTRVVIGVGALFDNLAGRVPRAPHGLRRLRGEWLFRLWIEPQRLWRRYLLGNPLFLWRLLVTFGREPGERGKHSAGSPRPTAGSATGTTYLRSRESARRDHE